MFQEGDTCPNDGTRLVKIKAVVDPLLGRDLDGRYSIIEKLGQGGMGAVYRGSQYSVGREVAIKLVGAHLVSDPDVVKRFLREAKLASKLSHPNAVQVLDFGQTDDGLFYLVMELVNGRTLDLIIKKEKVFRADRIVRIGTQVCDALEVAHSLSIVHRDLKPANIMLLDHGRDLVKVLDFGLAKSVSPDQTSTTMTNAGALLGTPAYMPPELALGQSCDGRADLYSLGVILYLLGSGRLPFVSDSAHELIAMHGVERAPPMTGVPQELADVIDRLLEKKPEDRFDSAKQTREALEAAIEGRFTPLPMRSTQPPTDTNPSLGPFPAPSSLFKHLTTPVPGRVTPTPRTRSQTEMERLISSDTVAANATTAAAVHDTSLDHGGKKRRWLIPVFGLLVAGAGAGVFVMMNQNNTSDETQTAAPAPEETTQTPPTPTPPVESKPAGEVPTKVEQPPVVTTDVPPVEKSAQTPETKPETKPEKRTKKVTKKTPKTPTEKAEKTETKVEPPAGAGSGSAKKPALPF